MLPILGAATSLLGAAGSAAAPLAGMFGGGQKTKVSSATGGPVTMTFGAQNRGAPPWVWPVVIGVALLAGLAWLMRRSRN